MKSLRGFKIVLVSLVATFVCANVSTADMSALPSGHIAACDCLRPSAVPALEGTLFSRRRAITALLQAFSGREINSRYSQGCLILAFEGLDLTGSITAAPAMHAYGELALELPDATQIRLTGGSDYHRFSGLDLFDRMLAVAGICDQANEHVLTAIDLTEWLASPWSRRENALRYLYGTAFGNAIRSRSY